MATTSKQKTAAKKIVPKKKNSKKKAVKKKAEKKKVTKKKTDKTRKSPVKHAAEKLEISSESEMSSAGITPDERWKWIAVAAYHKAEKRGFSPGNELQDWAEAEKEIDELMPG